VLKWPHGVSSQTGGFFEPSGFVAADSVGGRIAGAARLAALAQRVNRELLVEITRTVLADLRGRITGGGAAAVIALDSSALEERITSMVETGAGFLASASDQCNGSDIAHESGKGAAERRGG